MFAETSKRLWTGARNVTARSAKLQRVRCACRVLHGPSKVVLTPDEVGLVLVGRDMAFHLKEMLEYHFALGVGHVVYVDNGSSDASIDIVAQFPNTTVVSCDVSFSKYQGELRHIATSDYLEGGWRLGLDPDERLDYPNKDLLSLPELAKRLSKKGMSGIAAQMLEHVPSGSLVDDGCKDFDEARAKFRYYSLGSTESSDYHDPDAALAGLLQMNEVCDGNISFKYGGVRRKLFGENNALTKHPFFMPGPNTRPFANPHVTTGLKLPAHTILLRHYKFADDWVARETRLIEENRLSHGEARQRIGTLEQNSDLNLSAVALQEARDDNLESLYEDAFLERTDQTAQLFKA